MTYDREREGKEVIVFLLAGVLLYLVWRWLQSRGTNTAPASLPSIVESPAIVSGSVSPVIPLSQTTPAAAGCDCSSGCVNSPYTVPGLAQIQAIAQNANDSIIAAGNSTLQAIAEIGENTNPFLTVNFASPGG